MMDKKVFFPRSGRPCASRKAGLLAALLLFFSVLGGAKAQTPQADSVDVLHYALTLDMGHSVAGQVCGEAEITFRFTRSCQGVAFDLVCDTVRQVWVDGAAMDGIPYNADTRRLTVDLNDGGQAGDTHVVRVDYVTRGYVESYGWGGLHLDANIWYNLGVAFREYPHVFGRSWFPCRDNFYDKATYTFTVTSRPGWRAICGGVRQSETFAPDGSSTSVWQIAHPASTYLASASSAPWHIMERTYQGHYDTYPALIGYTSQDSTHVEQAYDIVEAVLPAYERAFGPYRWGRVGYIATPQGSMEHVTNIGLVASCMDNLDASCQMVICHELGHAWFGNLVTCASAGDMWINEGGATFCEEVATEAAFGREAADDYYQDKLSDVLRTAHTSDGGYLPLSGMPETTTYGTTTYQKGAMVWHSLRGLLGDSLFYACMRRLFDRCAFGTIDAAALRDSLSLYSGADLSDFFDFHVFGTGVVDYSIDNLAVEGTQATLTLRQLLRGTQHYARGNRVPVTFYSASLERSAQWMEFDDSVGIQTFSLPFEAAFAVVDPEHRLSDACTDDTASLGKKGQTHLANAYCKISVTQAAASGWAHVGHHFVAPSASAVPAGVVRLASRYWQVAGSIPADGSVRGYFLYNFGSNNSVGAAGLDAGFYEKRQTLDSIVLLYRPTPADPWQAVSHRRSTGSATANGYFMAALHPGQYTLAVADTALIGIAPVPSASDKASADAEVRVVPNPNSTQFRLFVEGCDKKFDASLFDSTGKKVLQMHGLHSGDTVTHHLPCGTYLLLIQNKFISLQSQIVVQ